MPESKKRCAVVGIGNRAHSWIGGIVERHPSVTELVGLCDVEVARCQDINEAYKSHAAVYDDYDRMLAETKPDLVIVVSPERYHREHIVKALDSGCDVATEKPLCTRIEDAEAIMVMAAEQRNGRKIFMAFNYRHIPLCSKIREMVITGAIGLPVSMDLTWYLDYRGHGTSYFRRWHRLMRESGGLQARSRTTSRARGGRPGTRSSVRRRRSAKARDTVSLTGLRSMPSTSCRTMGTTTKSSCPTSPMVMEAVITRSWMPRLPTSIRRAMN